MLPVHYVQKQLQQEQHILDPGHVSDGNSSRRSSTSGAAASDEEVLQQPEQQEQAEAIAEGPYASARQRDKEWAALTTWLRMNLHHVSGWYLFMEMEFLYHHSML